MVEMVGWKVASGRGCRWLGVLEERERVERAWRNSKVLGLGFRGFGVGGSRGNEEERGRREAGEGGV